MLICCPVGGREADLGEGVFEAVGLGCAGVAEVGL